MRLLESIHQAVPSILHEEITEQHARIQAEYACAGTRLQRQTDSVVVGLFAEREELERAVAALQANGVDDERITAVGNVEAVQRVLHDRKADLTSSDATAAIEATLRAHDASDVAVRTDEPLPQVV